MFGSATPRSGGRFLLPTGRRADPLSDLLEVAPAGHHLMQQQMQELALSAAAWLEAEGPVAAGTAPTTMPLDPPAEYREHAAKLQARAAAEAARIRRVSPALAAERAPARSRVSPRTRHEVATTAALFSSAEACDALLKGGLAPARFAEEASRMPSAALEVQMAALGSCVAQLGGTLQSLQVNLKRQVASGWRHQTKAAVESVRARATGLDGMLQSVGEDARAAAREAEADCELLVGHAATHHERAAANARLWTRALTCAVVSESREAAQAPRAVRDIVVALESPRGEAMAALVDSISFHAQHAAGCAEACVYVLDETLLRLANTHATEEERALCSPELSLIGAAAAKVSVKSIAGSALRANVGAATLVERARGDNRYHEPTDRLPGRAVPGALLYVSLSDARSTADGGGLRAVVRCARPWASVPGGAVFTPERQRALQRLAPLFSLALRACVAAETTARREEAARAALMASVGRSLGVPTVGLGPLMGTWAETCREAAGAERCCLFLHDAAARQLLTFLPGEAAAARIDVDDKRAALVAACARRNEVINVTDVSKEPRYDAEADTLAGLATLSALTLPFESTSSGGVFGVCQLLNKRPASSTGDAGDSGAHFTDDDVAELKTVLQMAALALEHGQMVQSCVEE